MYYNWTLVPRIEETSRISEYLKILSRKDFANLHGPLVQWVLDLHHIGDAKNARYAKSLVDNSVASQKDTIHGLACLSRLFFLLCVCEFISMLDTEKASGIIQVHWLVLAEFCIYALYDPVCIYDKLYHCVQYTCFKSIYFHVLQLKPAAIVASKLASVNAGRLPWVSWQQISSTHFIFSGTWSHRSWIPWNLLPGCTVTLCGTRVRQFFCFWE